MPSPSSEPQRSSVWKSSLCLLPVKLLCVCALFCLTLQTPWAVAARLPCPWDSPGKDTGGCPSLLQKPYVYPQIHSVAAGLKCKESSGAAGNPGSSGQPWRPGVTTMDFPMGFPRPSPAGGHRVATSIQRVSGLEHGQTEDQPGERRPGERCKRRGPSSNIVKTFKGGWWQSVQGSGGLAMHGAQTCRSHGQLTLALEHSSGLAARAPLAKQSAETEGQGKA